MGEVSGDRVARRAEIRRSLWTATTEFEVLRLQVEATLHVAEAFDSYLKLQEMEARVKKLEEQLRG